MGLDNRFEKKYTTTSVFKTDPLGYLTHSLDFLMVNASVETAARVRPSGQSGYQGRFILKLYFNRKKFQILYQPRSH